MLCYEIRETRLGPVTIGADDEAVLWVFMRCGCISPGRFVRTMNPVLTDAFSQLDEYLEGERRTFSVRVRQEGTDFQRRVWDAMTRIPYGETMSYGELAVAIGMMGAARAVGGAVKMNNTPVFVPCHRVIAAGGRLGGYSSGLDLKLELLRIEGVMFRDEQITISQIDNKINRRV